MQECRACQSSVTTGSLIQRWTERSSRLAGQPVRHIARKVVEIAQTLGGCREHHGGIDVAVAMGNDISKADGSLEALCGNAADDLVLLEAREAFCERSGGRPILVCRHVG